LIDDKVLMINKLKSFISDVDFEMKKVSWPTWDELRGSTYVVISLTLILGVYLFFSDLILSKILSVLL
jgi:preprotein translocase subunit SecE